MPISTYFLLISSIALATFSQVVLKIGMSSEPVQLALSRRQPIDTVASIITSPWVLGGLTCFGLSAVVWLLVLSRMNLSQAYPCVALGFVLTMCAGYFLLGEPINMLRIGGLSLILAGVACVAVS
ncbi:multidrug efflux SMR transporter [Roseomonas gilardii]|uniref:DMT family transporter n=1 Tax=Roseomonas gilardii TaxID=257708 RepID=UPI0011A89DF7|nr:EamA family transporter [Roseomonas gilardii]